MDFGVSEGKVGAGNAGWGLAHLREMGLSGMKRRLASRLALLGTVGGILI